MNKGAFGIPSEDYGFSNNARSTFGPPSFESAQVAVKAGKQQLSVHVK